MQTKDGAVAIIADDDDVARRPTTTTMATNGTIIIAIGMGRGLDISPTALSNDDDDDFNFLMMACDHIMVRRGDVRRPDQVSFDFRTPGPLPGGPLLAL